MPIELSSLERWSRAHVSFDPLQVALRSAGASRGSFDSSPGSTGSSPASRDAKEFQRILEESPNGKLYYDSTFLRSQSSSPKTYLGHVTYRLQEIRREKAIYASGGCLVGSVYCFPLVKTEGSSFRLHNLGQYIYDQEVAGRSQRGAPDVLLFEIEHPHGDIEFEHASSRRGVWRTPSGNSVESGNSGAPLLGIDYLRLGEIHYRLFMDLEHLLSSRERFELKRVVESRILRAMPFLKLCVAGWSEELPIKASLFFPALIAAIPQLPILGYLHFECIAEYLMLFADNDEATKSRELGEMYNVPYKELMYHFRPSYRQNFRLHDFDVSLNALADYIEQRGYIRSFGREHFASYVQRKMISLVSQRLVTEGSSERVADCSVWDFTRLSELLLPLVGHTIHRELRSFGRYPDFYFYYDQMKALQAWNYWNQQGIATPFNGAFPKDEVGINPANPDLSINVYRCETRARDGDTYATPVERLDVRLVPRLVDLKHTLMRNKPGIHHPPCPPSFVRREGSAGEFEDHVGARFIAPHERIRSLCQNPLLAKEGAGGGGTRVRI